MHKIDKILYCKNEDCLQAICPLCMSEKHRNHQVVNIVEKEMEAAVSGLDSLHVELNVYKHILQAVKQVEECTIDCMIERLKNKKVTFGKNFDKTLKKIEDKIATIDDLKKDVLQQYGINKLMRKLDIIEKEKTLVKYSIHTYV